jgi:hypothetical protein
VRLRVAVGRTLGEPRSLCISAQVYDGEEDEWVAVNRANSAPHSLVELRLRDVQSRFRFVFEAAGMYPIDGYRIERVSVLEQ